MSLKKIFFLVCAMQVAISSYSQLCQGSLGEPIVNITFGSGPNPGPSLPAATTNYQYFGSDCPTDGFYTVRNRSDKCYGGWHTLNTDHTGNGNGYFMLVNASNQPSDFYIDTVDLFCSNTTYEFAAWVVNMNSPSECSGAPRQPNLTFTIEKTDGTVLQSFNSGNIPPQSTLSWRQYGFYFSTPSNVNKVVLRIRNNAPGGCGNDLALDDITFRPCGPLITSSIDGNGSTKNFCEGQGGQALLNSTIPSGFINPVFQWQESTNNGTTWTDIAGATTQSLVRTFPPNTAIGTYLYRLAVNSAQNSGSPLCKVYSSWLTVAINQKPVVTTSNSGPVCERHAIQLIASGGQQYTWSGPSGFTGSGGTVNMVSTQLSNSGRYYVTVSNNNGCSQIDSTDVIINPAPVASVANDISSICDGDSVRLLGSGGGNYIWTPADDLSSASISNPFAYPKDSTQYQLVVSNSIGCTDTVFAFVNVNKKPMAFAGPDKNIVEGQKVQLLANASGTNVAYQWSPPNSINNVNALQPFVNPTADTRYVLSVSSNEGCGIASDTVLVKVYKGIYIPTAFTPNQDGKNDVWLVIGLAVYRDYEILVFNRYGEVIYKTTNAEKGWDGMHKGKLAPNGTYAYLIKVKDISVTLSGLVTVIR